MRVVSLIATTASLMASPVMSQTSLTESEINVASQVTVVSFSDDSEMLLVATREGLKVWDFDRREFTEPDVSKIDRLDGTPFTVLRVGGFPRTFLLERPDGSVGQPQQAGNSADGRMVAYGNAREMRIVDYESGQRLLTFPSGIDVPTDVQFSPDGSLLAASYFDTDIYIWDVTAGRLANVIDELPLLTYSAKFTADGSHLITGGVDRIVRVWDMRGWREVRQFSSEHPEAIASLQVSADGRRVLTSGRDPASNLDPAHLVLWDAVDGIELIRVRLRQAAPPELVSFSPNGRMIAVAERDELRIRLWTVAY